MKLKKILALVCSVAMSASLFVSTAVVADAAVDGATATLEFAGYETKGAATFAKINVKATIPDTLVPYELVAADWVNTFEDTYKGLMVQSVGFDIPYVDGLAYTASLSSCAEYVQLQNNSAASKVTVYALNTGAYDTYYAGEVGTLATLYYRITGDVNATYNVALTDAVIGLLAINETTGSGTEKAYTKNDFTITNATVKPEVSEPTYEDKYVNATTVEFAALGDNEVAGTDVATAYKASYTFAGTEKAAAWTADDKQDLTINIANISGETTLGLIVTDGTVSNVQLKVTALAD